MGGGGRGQLHHSIVTSPVGHTSEARLNHHPTAENGLPLLDQEHPVPTEPYELGQVP